MTKFSKIALAALLTLSATSLYADAEKGQKLYSKKIKENCNGKSGADFAATHTQFEWMEINEGGTFIEEVKIICPDATVKEGWVEHLYDFANEYASDSGNVPSC
jgi:hypothetical protein